jgi:hypothetical protein
MVEDAHWIRDTSSFYEDSHTNKQVNELYLVLDFSQPRQKILNDHCEEYVDKLAAGCCLVLAV